MISKKILKLCYIIIFRILSILPLNNNKIILLDGVTGDIDGNNLEIYKVLLKQRKYKFIFISLFSTKTKLIKAYNVCNILSIYHIATGKYLFANSGFYNFLPLKSDQKNIQLWHGAGAFKKFGFDLKEKERNRNNYKTINLLSVTSDKVIDIYANAFKISKEKVKNLGIPRADIFFKEEEKQKIKKEFYKNYSEFKSKKIILYAPTFRDNEKNKFNLKLDIELMKESLEGLNYILLLKLHPGIKSKNIQVDNRFSYNFSDYSNTADLLIISDILISDYSSIIFEFSIMKKPILFYAYDVEEYIKDRGFYYNYYDFIPNKISYTTEEIIKAVINQEWDLERIEKFARYFFNPFDGNSTERVLKEVGLWEENK